MKPRTFADASADLFALASMLRASKSHLVAFQEERRRDMLEEGKPACSVGLDLDDVHDVELTLHLAASLLDDLAFEFVEAPT